MNGSTPSNRSTAAPLGSELAAIEDRLDSAARELRALAQALRERASGGREVAAPPADDVQVALAPTPKTPRVPRRARAIGRRRIGTVALALAAAALAGGTLGLVPAAAQRTDATSIGPSVVQVDPRTRAARDARVARTYVWSAVPGARGYEVRLERGGRAVFETTTKRLAIELPAELQLSPGRYTWLVTPVPGNGAAATRPVVEGTFVVQTD